MAATDLCTWCGHADHDGPCQRRIVTSPIPATKSGRRVLETIDCPCIRHLQPDTAAPLHLTDKGRARTRLRTVEDE